MSNSEKTSYGRIVKSSALLGGSSMVDVLLRIIRIKILAVLLGPAGVGITSLYSSFIDVMVSVTSLGIRASAVREVSNAVASGDEVRVSRVAEIVRRLALITGLMGLVTTVCIANQASWWIFQNTEHAWAIAVLGIAVLFTQLKNGHIALLSGLRRIKEVAKVNVLGAALATVAGIPLLFLFRENAIIPFLLAITVGQVVASWWFSRRLSLPAISAKWKECAVESKSMITLGLAVMLSAVVGAMSVFVIRLIIQRYLGEDSVGIFQAAYALSGVYVGFILQAMSGDYFPRLVGAKENLEMRNRFANEQAEVAILVAVPGLILLLLFSDLLIWIMYSEKFVSASDVLRWQIIGMLGRIISWPMGFILLARTDKKAFFWSEFLTAWAHVGLVWIGIQLFGLIGAGMAFAALNFLHMIFIYWIVKVRHAYDCRVHLVTLTTVGILLVSVTFGITFISNPMMRYVAGGTLLGISSVWSLRGLVRRLGKDKIMALFHRISNKVSFISS